VKNKKNTRTKSLIVFLISRLTLPKGYLISDIHMIVLDIK